MNIQSLTSKSVSSLKWPIFCKVKSSKQGSSWLQVHARMTRAHTSAENIIKITFVRKTVKNENIVLRLIFMYVVATSGSCSNYYRQMMTSLCELWSDLSMNLRWQSDMAWAVTSAYLKELHRINIPFSGHLSVRCRYWGTFKATSSALNLPFV